MKAIVIRSYGGPEVLQFAEVPQPIPEVGQALIRVAASGVNPADAKWRAGMFAQMVPMSFPYVPGYDVAGTIERGSAFAMGARVCAMLDNRRAGGYADFVTVAQSDVALIPSGLDDVVAAALPTAALTGVQMIDEHIQPKPGECVLITGATGSVGRFALYAAKTLGVRVIAAVRESQAREALALGAEAICVLGAEPAPGLSWDHVADTVGGMAVAALCRGVAGRIRTASTTPIPTDGLLSVPEFFAVHADGRRLTALAGAVAAGKVLMPIARLMQWSEASTAHRLLEAGGVGGKIVLSH